MDKNILRFLTVLFIVLTVLYFVTPKEMYSSGVYMPLEHEKPVPETPDYEYIYTWK